MIDYLVNNENKKASTVPPVKAKEDYDKSKFKNSNNSIPQNTKKDTKKENKNNTGKGASANVNNTFMKYEADELEKLLQEQQSKKFKPNYPINN